MMDIDVTEVDGRKVDFKSNPFKTLFFQNTNPKSQTTRKLKLKNTSPILVPFHWSVYREKNAKRISLADEETHYKIEPIQGKIEGGGEMEFTFYFAPFHAEPYYEYCDFIVEDIPI